MSGRAVHSLHKPNPLFNAVQRLWLAPSQTEYAEVLENRNDTSYQVKIKSLENPLRITAKATSGSQGHNLYMLGLPNIQDAITIQEKEYKVSEPASPHLSFYKKTNSRDNRFLTSVHMTIPVVCTNDENDASEKIIHLYFDSFGNPTETQFDQQRITDKETEQALLQIYKQSAEPFVNALLSTIQQETSRLQQQIDEVVNELTGISRQDPNLTEQLTTYTEKRRRLVQLITQQARIYTSERIEGELVLAKKMYAACIKKSSQKPTTTPNQTLSASTSPDIVETKSIPTVSENTIFQTPRDRHTSETNALATEEKGELSTEQQVKNIIEKNRELKFQLSSKTNSDQSTPEELSFEIAMQTHEQLLRNQALLANYLCGAILDDELNIIDLILPNLNYLPPEVFQSIIIVLTALQIKNPKSPSQAIRQLIREGPLSNVFRSIDHHFKCREPGNFIVHMMIQTLTEKQGETLPIIPECASLLTRAAFFNDQRLIDVMQKLLPQVAPTPDRQVIFINFLSQFIIQKTDSAQLKFLLSSISTLNKEVMLGYLCLHATESEMENTLALITLLMNEGIDLNQLIDYQQDNENVSYEVPCLFIACAKGHLQIVKKLVDDGHANVDQEIIIDGSSTRTASFYARNHPEITDYLNQHSLQPIHQHK